jgi:hypothetical protein
VFEDEELDALAERLRPDPAWPIRKQEQHVQQALAQINRAVLETLSPDSGWRSYALDAQDWWTEWFADPRNREQPLPFGHFTKRLEAEDR